MKLNSVQAMRAIAALAVVMCHLFAIETKHAGGPTVLTDIWINGATGVDLFFVISGFIMVWVAGDTPKSLRGTGQFLFARATRIYPLWWLFAAMMAGYFFIAYGQPWDAARLALKDMNGPQHLIESMLLLPQADHPVLGVGWTLVHEMYFYIGFALLLLILPVRYRIVGIIVWGWLVIAGSLLGLSDVHAGNFVELAFYPMTFEFVLGALVAYAIKAGWRRYATLTSALGAVGLVAAFLSFNFTTGGPLLSPLGLTDIGSFTLGWGRTLCFGLPTALLLHGLVSLELEGNLRVPRLLVSIGDWSYALYLCHILVLSAVARLFFPVFGGAGLIDNIAFLILGMLASIIVSALTYRWFEKPLLAIFRNIRRRFAAPPPVLAE